MQKTMEMIEVWPDAYNEDMYINSILNPLTKLTNSSRSTEFKDILQWNISQMIKDHPSQHKNSQRLCDEIGILFWVYWEVNGNWANNMIRISDYCQKKEISAANKGWSKDNYCQSLTFDHPCLSCSDHYDWWLFQKIFFFINIFIS